MDKEKRIKEIAKDIPFLELEREVFVSSDRKEKHSWMLSEEDTTVIAEVLYDKGYRKESDTVKEILQKIHNHFKCIGGFRYGKVLAKEYGVEIK